MANPHARLMCISSRPLGKFYISIPDSTLSDESSRYNHGHATGAEVKLNGGLELREGDGAFAGAAANEKIQIENTGDRDAEILVFDLE
jgi:hypothetical protein